MTVIAVAYSCNLSQVSGTLNTYFLLTSDWKKLSDEVVEYNEANDVYLSDEDSD